jgi:hypothetical protein
LPVGTTDITKSHKQLPVDTADIKEGVKHLPVGTADSKESQIFISVFRKILSVSKNYSNINSVS